MAEILIFFPQLPTLQTFKDKVLFLEKYLYICRHLRVQYWEAGPTSCILILENNFFLISEKSDPDLRFRL